MATPQLSPGVIVREIDLTAGRVQNVVDTVGAIAGPFSIGPVEGTPTRITTQQEFIDTFGKPLSTDRQYEYWMSGTEYLSYGGVLSVVRVDGSTLNNANAGTDEAYDSSFKVKNFDDYEANYKDTTAVLWTARNPGSWANKLKVCVIDGNADQRIGISYTNPVGAGFTVGYGVTTGISTSIAGDGTTSSFDGYLKGIITGVTTDSVDANSSIDVKIVARVSTSTTQYNTTLESTTSQIIPANSTLVAVESVAGISTLDTLTLCNASGQDIQNWTITAVGTTNVTIGAATYGIIQSGVAVTFSKLVTVGGTTTNVDYTENLREASFTSSDTLYISNTVDASDNPVNSASSAVRSVEDWYDAQTLGLTNSTVYWKSLAPKPVTSNYVSSRNGRFDAVHVAIVDDTGDVTGVEGNILEKWVGLSKAADAILDGSSPTKSYYKTYIQNNSAYVYAGYNPSNAYDSQWGTTPRALGFSTQFQANTFAQGLWGQDAQNTTFSGLGNISYTLTGGVDYSAGGGMSATLANLKTGYELFDNKDETTVDYLLMGPSGGSELESQAKANLLISIANSRKDCIAVVSPHREHVVGVTNATTQTNNILKFYSSVSSSSYAIFDSGYKYTYDRFNNEFRYLPCNADVAGLCVRTSINSFPWFSPAGARRGILNNAVKLAYNPTKDQRDLLYDARINPISNIKGSGIQLFGDKTGLSYPSAFDRINVRRLFLTVEQALEGAANAQLFEINDEDTRENFTNIVTPYLRDIQSNRGIENFKVICDESNNTPDVVDNNEFRADIFIQPSKSINYVTLTFVATRTGISFAESV